MKVIKENENQNIIWHYSCIFYNMPGAWIWFVSGQNRKCSHGTKAYAFNGKLDGDNHFVSGKFALQEKGAVLLYGIRREGTSGKSAG